MTGLPEPLDEAAAKEVPQNIGAGRIGWRRRRLSRHLPASQSGWLESPGSHKCSALRPVPCALFNPSGRGPTEARTRGRARAGAKLGQDVRPTEVSLGPAHRGHRSWPAHHPPRRRADRCGPPGSAESRAGGPGLDEARQPACREPRELWRHRDHDRAVRLCVSGTAHTRSSWEPTSSWTVVQCSPAWYSRYPPKAGSASAHHFNSVVTWRFQAEFAGPELFGSCSSDLLSGLGPGPVEAGDELSLGNAGIPRGYSAAIARVETVRLVPGPEPVDLELLAEWAREPFEVSPESNRVGVRLRPSRPVELREPPRGSHGMVPGAVQIPPSGEPIVLLCDHATMGGYPVVATVISADLGVIAQRRPGEAVQFELVDVDAGHRGLERSRSSARTCADRALPDRVPSPDRPGLSQPASRRAAAARPIRMMRTRRGPVGTLPREPWPRCSRPTRLDTARTPASLHAT